MVKLIHSVNLANLLNLTNVELWLVIVEVTVLSLFVFGLFYFRSLIGRCTLKQPSFDSDDLKDLVRQSESICLDLSKNLEEKKEIANRLLEQLDNKIQSLHAWMNQIEQAGPSHSQDPRENDVNHQILEMAEEGRDISEIADRTKLPKGEVQLILDLYKYRQ